MPSTAKTRSTQAVVRLPEFVLQIISEKPHISSNLSHYTREAVRHYQGPVYPVRQLAQHPSFPVGTDKLGELRLPVRLTKAEKRDWTRRSAGPLLPKPSLNALACSAVCAALGIDLSLLQPTPVLPPAPLLPTPALPTP